jgi:hypothetical protein
MQLVCFLHVFDMFLYLKLHVGLNGFFNWVYQAFKTSFVVVMEQTHTMGSSSSKYEVVRIMWPQQAAHYIMSGVGGWLLL